MIIEQIGSYLNWCKVHNLVPNEYKNLKTYCLRYSARRSSKHKYVLKHE